MKRLFVEATWRSQHMVELADDCTQEDLFEILQDYGQADLVGFTTSEVEASLDGTLNEILGGSSE